MSPADAIPRKPWPLWRKLVAYIILLVVSSASICFIDGLAMHQAATAASPSTQSPTPSAGK